MRHDTLIRNALIHDGSGRPPVQGDIGIRDDRIASLGSRGGDANIEIDAAGMVAAPGFIDVHTHDDFAAILHPDMGFKLLGGVTTCVVGNCGFGAAPHGAAAVMARAFHPEDSIPEWEGYGGYLDHLDAHPPSVNIGALVGHGTLRLGAMGNEKREPNGAELEAMKAGLREGLDAGALGMSTGLIYDPGRHAQMAEIVALASEMRGSGALYTSHLRDEGEGLLDAVDEAIEIGARAGVPVQISHHKASGRTSWGRVRESLQRIERGQREGVRVRADQYPYTAGSTILAAVVPTDDSGRGAGLGGEDLGAEDVVIASARSRPEWEGRSLADLSKELGLPPREAAAHVLAQEPGTTVVLHSMSEDDVQTVMRHPSTMIGSDGIPTLAGKPHPRLYGTFARVLGRYARDLGLFSLAEAIHRMTGLSAQTFGLVDRGLLCEGAFADLVVFDPAAIRDVGTYDDPNHPPEGIAHVFVNGQHAVSQGRHTGARSGRAIRRV